MSHDCLQSMIENSKKKRKKKKRYFSSVKRIVYSTSLLFDIDCRCVLFFSSISTLKPPPASTIRHSLPHPSSSSSLPPPHLFSSLQTRSNYVGSSLAIFLKISGREYLIQGNQDILEPRSNGTRAFPCTFSFFSKGLPKSSNHMTGSGKFESCVLLLGRETSRSLSLSFPPFLFR